MSVVFGIEVERETDGRRLAEVVELPGVSACGMSQWPGTSPGRRVDRQAQEGVNGVTDPELRLRARSRRKAASASPPARRVGSSGSTGSTSTTLRTDDTLGVQAIFDAGAGCHYLCAKHALKNCRTTSGATWRRSCGERTRPRRSSCLRGESTWPRRGRPFARPSTARCALQSWHSPYGGKQTVLLSAHSPSLCSASSLLAGLPLGAPTSTAGWITSRPVSRLECQHRTVRMDPGTDGRRTEPA